MKLKKTFLIAISITICCQVLQAQYTSYSIINTFAGGGSSPVPATALNAGFSNAIRDVAIDKYGNAYVSDGGHHRVYKIDVNTKMVSLVAGDGIRGYGGDNFLATTASLNNPTSCAIDKDGNIYVVDSHNNRIRKIEAATGVIRKYAGGGPSSPFVTGPGRFAWAVEVSQPVDLVLDTNKNEMYFSAATTNAIFKVDATGYITVIAGTGTFGYSGDGGPATSAQLYGPHGLLLDRSGNLVFCDKFNDVIRKVDLSTGIITTVAGTGIGGSSGDGGPAVSANLYWPDDIAMDPAGNFLVADLGNNKMRLIDNTTGKIYTVAGTGTAGFSGDGGPAVNAELGWPDGMAIGPDGRTYIADQNNGRIRTFSSPVIVTPATVEIRMKVLLQGATLGNSLPQASLMRDNLRNSPYGGTNFIPAEDPYSSYVYKPKFTLSGDGLKLGYLSVSDPRTIFNDNGNNSVVDWIFIELRDRNNPSTVLGSRSALVRRNGMVAEVDGGDTIRFPSLPASGQYYVSVRHRHHLGTMTAMPLSSDRFDGTTLIDFTTMTGADLWHSDPAYDGLEQATLSDGTKALWAGNASGDALIGYVSGADDAIIILSEVQAFGNAARSINYVPIQGYFRGDINMDSRCRYTGIGNDAAWIQWQIQSFPRNALKSINYPAGIPQQLP